MTKGTKPMTDIRTVPREKLDRLIGETETHLVMLKSEIDRRDEDMQHSEVERLEEHLRNTESSLRGLREFFSYLSEMRAAKSRP